MLPRALPKPQLMVDIAFGEALGVLYIIFSLSLRGIQSEVNALFLASYALLGLGALVLYLVFSANPNLALLLHIFTFPLFSLFNLFLKWVPDAIGRGADVQVLSSLILVYVLLLLAFFVVQSILRTRTAGRIATV
ncbi:hypothetical protein ES703_13732 [subsurface metagenome]|nr:MAG: hypothetical protein CEE41_04900 [Hadesarchaea archaeon B3_Hades]